MNGMGTEGTRPRSAARGGEAVQGRVAGPAEAYDIVVLGSGGASFGFVDQLASQGYGGSVACISATEAGFTVKPLLPDVLIGTIDWRKAIIPPPPGVLAIRDEVVSLDETSPAVQCASGVRRTGRALFIALGAYHPVPAVPVATETLETLDDARRIAGVISRWRRIAIAGLTIQAVEWCRIAASRGIAADLYLTGEPDVALMDIFQSDLSGLFSFLRGKGITIVEMPAEQGPAADRWDPYDAVVNAMRRRPATAPIPLDRLEEGFVPVDALLRGPVAGWWCGGDMAYLVKDRTYAPIPLSGWSHAEAQGRLAAINVLGKDRRWTSDKETLLPRLWGDQLLSRWR